MKHVISYVVTNHGQIVRMRAGQPERILSFYDSVLLLEKLGDERPIDAEAAMREYKNLECAIQKVDSMVC